MNFLERALDGRNQFGKYMLVFGIGFLGGQFLGGLFLFGAAIAMMFVAPPAGGAVGWDVVASLNWTAMGFSHNGVLCLMLIPFVISLFLTLYLIRLLHGRTLAGCVNGTLQIRWRRIASGALVWSVLLAVSLLMDWLIDPGNYVFQLDWGKFLLLTVITFCLVPFQTTFEEVFFRGYLAQGIAGWTRSRWLAILIPGTLFGLMHIANPEIKEFGFWKTMPVYILYGLVFGLISVLDDGIELPVGIHTANNVFTCLFTTYPASALPTDALFQVQRMDPADGFIQLLVTSGVLVTYFAIKYKWDFKLLNQKIRRTDN
jgi:membrane protease YdiL (CAAX protease family)